MTQGGSVGIGVLAEGALARGVEPFLQDGHRALLVPEVLVETHDGRVRAADEKLELGAPAPSPPLPPWPCRPSLRRAAPDRRRGNRPRRGGRRPRPRRLLP